MKIVKVDGYARQYIMGNGDRVDFVKIDEYLKRKGAQSLELPKAEDYGQPVDIPVKVAPVKKPRGRRKKKKD